MQVSALASMRTNTASLVGSIGLQVAMLRGKHPLMYGMSLFCYSAL
jgi:hypothetical protein